MSSTYFPTFLIGRAIVVFCDTSVKGLQNSKVKYDVTIMKTCKSDVSNILSNELLFFFLCMM